MATLASLQPMLTPMRTGVKTAGGGYYPRFQATNGCVVDEQPEARTPVQQVAYYNTLKQRINKGRVDAPTSSPFETLRRKPSNSYPQSVRQAPEGADNLYRFQYKETTNATDNRMLAERQRIGASTPHQWAKPEHTHYRATGRMASDVSMVNYFENITQNNTRALADKLKAKGYSVDEIVEALNKKRQADLEKAIENPLDPKLALEGVLAKHFNVSMAVGENYTNEGNVGFDKAPVNNHSSAQIIRGLQSSKPLTNVTAPVLPKASRGSIAQVALSHSLPYRDSTVTRKAPTLPEGIESVSEEAIVRAGRGQGKKTALKESALAKGQMKITSFAKK